MNPTRPVPDRPRGVWLLTIYALVFAGALPLALAVFVLASGGAGSLAGGASLVYSILICGGVIVTAIGAWRGQERARLGLMVLVTLFYASVGINNLLLMWLGEVNAAEATRVTGRVLRGVVFPALYIWYFTRPATRAYYRVMESIRKSRAPGETRRT
jgi:hypothetical protein